jgi:hypothetical protein
MVAEDLRHDLAHQAVILVAVTAVRREHQVRVAALQCAGIRPSGRSSTVNSTVAGAQKSASAARSSSARPVPPPASTSTWTDRPGRFAHNVSRVPPAPMGMSSQWAASSATRSIPGGCKEITA